MSDIAVQASFNSGEWAPALTARVDLTKYRAGAALLENFFVDYRGGASTRPGTKYIIQTYRLGYATRLIPFQASFNVGYILEFGQNYIRFIYNGSPVLENAFSITGATQANPCVIQVTGNNFIVGDWIYIANINGMTQLDGRFFNVLGVTGNAVTLGTLTGGNIDSTSYSPYTNNGTVQRIYTIPSPYSSNDLAMLKFAQSTNQMIICNAKYPTYVLTLVTAINWTLAPVTIGSTASPPTSLSPSSTLGAGPVSYSYGVTSIDGSGQESAVTITGLVGYKDIRSNAGSNQISWSGVQGAIGYNIYESYVSYFGAVPYGAEYGYIGSSKGTQFVDSNIGPDFAQTPPIPQNPFIGSGVDLVIMTANGTYTTVPTVSFTGGSPSIPATALAQLGTIGVPAITASGASFIVGDTVQFGNSLMLTVTAVSAGAITAWAVTNGGSITSGSTPTNPIAQIATSGVGTGATATVTWGVVIVIVLTSGAGYTSAPTVVFSAGVAAANAVLAPTSNGYPSVPSFFQERLVLAAPSGAPQTLYMSQPGSYYNFDISNPSKASDAIVATLVSGVLNTIKAIVSSTAGMLLLTDKASWLVNGGGAGSAVSPTTIVASAQSFVGANDVPPIVANYDVLYVQSKGSGIRDLAYNIYFNVFTGTDISVLSSHLFYGYQILEWAWAEQPFYVVWAVRSDGQLLSLTFLKEQDFIGWAHHTTQGNFKSIATITENTADAGYVDAIYTVVERTVEGQSLQYIERLAERIFPTGVNSAWCVDAGLQYNGSPQTSFTGAEHLAGLTVTGLADGVIITPFTMPQSGEFTLPTAASLVTIGLSYACRLQTLALDIQGIQVQGKMKKIPHVDVRVNNTLGLTIGPDFDHLTPMKDLVQGNVSSMLSGQESQVVAGLYTGDARTFLPNSSYTIPGQYCIEQSNPYPASVLGVFPAFISGDD